MTYMKDVRREEYVQSTVGMIRFIHSCHGDWMNAYRVGKKSDNTAYVALQRLLQRSAHRHGLTQRVPSSSKVSDPLK